MKAENNKSKNKIIAVLSFLTVAFFLLSVMNSVRVKNLQRDREVQSQKLLSELCESLDGITTGLHKSLYSGTGEMLRENGNDIYRKSTVAKVSLAGLSREDMATDDIYKFLSQVGDYTLWLSQKESFSLTREEKENLKKLYKYSEILSDAFEEISEDYYSGEINLEDDIDDYISESEEKINFSDRFTDTQQTMGDYPTLLYDGPFADTVINKDAKGLTGSEITSDEAAKKAAEILVCKQNELKREKDVDSVIDLYCFSRGEESIGITKKGGSLCYITSSEHAGEATISREEAVKRGREYLNKIGYKGMKETYYSTYDGICTVNYAWENKDTVYYADLIKVGISLETGKPVSVDAAGYLMNHTERKFTGRDKSVGECRRNISDELTVISSGKAVIPLETGKEALCYEFHCKDDDGQEALIYVDCKTAAEKDIVLLLYSDDGILTK